MRDRLGTSSGRVVRHSMQGRPAAAQVLPDPEALLVSWGTVYAPLGRVTVDVTDTADVVSFRRGVVVDGDVHPPPRELERDHPPHPPGRAGHERPPSAELHGARE